VTWRSGAAALALAALVAAGPLAARARGDDVSRAELARLAEAATTDERALERLRRVDSVGGRPVDIRRALAGASRDELDERLAALSASAPAGASPQGARERAHAILAERRFHRTELPRPFAGLLGWIGDRLRPVVDAINRALDALPGGDNVLWTIAGTLVAAAAVLVALRLARRRGAVAGGRPGSLPHERGVDPRELERRAEEAERRGDHETALRLRFRAGLLRLDRLRVVPFRESLTSGEVARRLRSPEFDRLARVFDEVVYGRRPPRPEDSEQAREGWHRVLAEAAAR
jgi:hypothetical protein